MLKICIITFLSCLIHVNTSFSQNQEVSPKNKVKASEINNSTLEKPKKVNYQSTPTETNVEPNSNNIQSNENQEYPKRISSGTKRSESNDQQKNNLSKKDRIEQIDNHLKNIDVKKEFVLSNRTEENEEEVEKWLSDTRDIKEKLLLEKEQLLKDTSTEK